MIELPAIVYLGGLGRSGSTLLERLIAELPGVAGAGELVHLWQRAVLDDERCGCSRTFSRCPFWRRVGDAAFGGWSGNDARRVLALREHVDRTRHIPRLALGGVGDTLPHGLEEYLSHYFRLYGAIATAAGSDVVLDSSKHASLAFCLRWSQLDVRVVHVIRDSRAVAYSWTKQVRRPETTSGELMTRYSPARSSGQWLTDNLAFELLARRGTPVLRIRYEDLTSEPAAVLTKVAHFIGKSVPPELLDALDRRCVDLRSGHQVAGNPMRFKTGPLEIREDDVWRTALPPRDRRTVTVATAPLLRRYGYSVSARAST